MTDEEATNLAVVRRMFEEHDFFGRANESTLLHEAPSLPYGGSYRGVEAMTLLIRRMRATWKRPGSEEGTVPTLHTEVEYAVGGDMVFVHLELSGTRHQSGKSFRVPVVETFRFQDGILKEIRAFYFDSAKAVECFV